MIKVLLDSSRDWLIFFQLHLINVVFTGRLGCCSVQVDGGVEIGQLGCEFDWAFPPFLSDWGSCNRSSLSHYDRCRRQSMTGCRSVLKKTNMCFVVRPIVLVVTLSCFIEDTCLLFRRTAFRNFSSIIISTWE